ncbi:MAG: family 78 glycoside hydrolase catalytic domain [Candidatus Hydrogenedentes bacterium]|nr:family 78 glycoside hydrolase catalytic domain [Candidatus Hydrogenedentota bacterium]
MVKRIVLLCLASLALLGLSWPCFAAGLQPASLRCEYLTDPIGLDVAAPRLSWVLESAQRAQRQTAYQVIVSSSMDVLAADQGDLWDSGKLESSQQNQIAYSGKALGSHQTCYWKVRVWNQDGAPGPWSEPSTWSMGFVSPEAWNAPWITSELDGAGSLPLFRREFSIAKPIQRAVVYVCGLGFHELHLNGQRVGDTLFEPGWTNYKKTCLYTAHDITPLVTEGANALGVMLGNGMYNVRGGRYVKFTGTFGPPMMTAMLRLEYADGTVNSIPTDTTWKTAQGPIAFSCIYGGEDYDARRESPGWDGPGCDDSAWVPATLAQGPGGRLTSESGPPIKVMEVRETVSVSQPKPGVFVYDLGQNMSGRPVLRVQGPRGSIVKMTPGELLDAEGLVSQKSSGGPVSFSYTLKGEGVEEWRPRFSYYGFRYVQVEGAAPADTSAPAEGGARVASLTGEFTHADAARVGEFSCSNPVVNRIHHLILAAIRSNFQSVLTDCPHREKLGWLEVSHLLAGGIMYNFDAARFYAKVERDMSDSQTETGLVPDIAPEYTVFSAGFRDSPEWGSASVINPWHVYQMYGDERLLRDYYDVMKRYADYLGSTANNHIVSHGLGDWYDIGPNPPGESQLTSKGVTATAVYYQNLAILERAARLLGKNDDALSFGERANAVRAAFNAEYYRRDVHQYDRNSQTANAMPLVLGLVEESERAAVAKNLVDDIRATGYRVTAGDVGFSYLVRALSDFGEGETLYRMVTQDTGPGYVYQLAQGATSLTEAWDASPASSNNHCMLGHAEEWFYRGLAGIRHDVDAPGFSRFILRPDAPEGLEWVKAHYDSIRGRISSEWHVDGSRFVWDMQIPPNTCASVYVPAKEQASVTEGGKAASDSEGVKFLRMEGDRAVFEVQSGTYQFVSERGDGVLSDVKR